MTLRSTPRAPTGVLTSALTRALSAALLALSPGTFAAHAADAPPPDLPALHAAISSPAIVGEIDAPERIEVGRGTILPAPGSRLLVLWAAGQNCALVARGGGQFVYRVEDPQSIPVTRRNLKGVGGVETRPLQSGFEISIALQGFAIWGWDLGVETEPGPAEGAQLPDWLTEILGRQVGANPGRDVLLSAFGGESGYRWALLHSRSDDFLLDVDPRPAIGAESLQRLRKLGSSYSRTFVGRLAGESLSRQPIGRPWSQPPVHQFVTLETAIRLENDRDDHARINTRTKVRALRGGLKVLSFHFSEHFFDNHGGTRPHRLTRLTVDGVAVPYLLKEGSLLIPLPKTLGAGEEAWLESESEGDILVRPDNSSYWHLGYEAWYPKPASEGTEWASFDLTVSARPPFVPFAPGTVVERTSSEAANVLVTRLEGPMANPNVLAGKYSTTTETHGDARVHVSSYAMSKETESRRIGRIVLAVRGCLESWLGIRYPFSDLQVLEVNSWGWGMAPPGLIFVTREAFINRASAAIDEGTRETAGFALRGINERIAHEVAHGWFPHVAKTLTPEENWLSESFADYTAVICLERAMVDKRKARDFLKRQLADWKQHTKDLESGSSIYLANHLRETDDDSRFVRMQLLYGKGPLVLHAIRQELRKLKGSEEAGDQLFYDWVRAYVQSSAYKSGETRNLIALLDRATGQPWQPWFEKYVYGTETPKVD